MSTSKRHGLVKAAAGVTIETAKELLSQIPLVGALIEGVKSYKEDIEEQQREEFVQALVARVEKVEAGSQWFQTDEGQEFVKKVVATALNAEYADKVNYLANALANGPQVPEDALRLKFVELVRQLSKSALYLLAAAVENTSDTGIVYSGALASKLGWKPQLADACVRELGAAGVFSSVKEWYWESQGEYYQPSLYSDKGQLLVTDLTRWFAAFISDEKNKS